MGSSKTVAFVHGWAEGSWQDSQFAQQLVNNGFELTPDPAKADIILAHSAGCYLVPVNPKAKLIVLIGLPFWPGKPLIKSLVKKLMLEASRHQKDQDLPWFSQKLAHNTWYIFTKPAGLYRFFKNRQQMKLPSASPNTSVVLIRNQDDQFCTPNVTKLLPQAKGYKFIDMPGLHDDCWIDPEPYVKLIKKYANELA